jgi:hypothetical protein
MFVEPSMQSLLADALMSMRQGQRVRDCAGYVITLL